MEQFAIRAKESKVPQSIQTTDERGYLSHYSKHGIRGKQLLCMILGKIVNVHIVHIFLNIADELYRG